MPNIMISCGEASGDLYASALARALKARAPDAQIWVMGGVGLAAAGAELAEDFHGLSVTGLAEAVAVLPRSVGRLRRLVAQARARRPDVLVAIDFPDFNLRLASSVKALGIPVVYYVAPQLWAWRPRRMHTLKRVADLVLVIFAFEAPLYREAGTPVEFVGHPLVDLVAPRESRKALLARVGLDPAAPTIALLPGSRANEVRAILPTLLRAADLAAHLRPELQFVIARAPRLSNDLFEPLPAPADRRIAIVEGCADDVLAAADVVATASGTATVQAALHERPMVVVYRLSPLTYRIGKPFLHVDTYAMVNLIAGRRIVVELMQDDFTAEAVVAEMLTLLKPDRAEAMREALRDVKDRLGGPGASDRAAAAVLRVAAGASRSVRAPESGRASRDAVDGSIRDGRPS
jgi:lipid-A-disaccharide synthase